MPNKTQKNEKFYEIISAITEIDEQLADIQKQLAEINTTGKPEVCPDELNGNKAVLETVRNMCINALLEGKPKGEA